MADDKITRNIRVFNATMICTVTKTRVEVEYTHPKCNLPGVLVLRIILNK